MIVPADVQTLRCRFVAEAAKYFKTKQYFVDYSTDSAKCAWIDYLASKNYVCLDDETSCVLATKASKSKLIPCVASETITCDSQLSVALSVVNTYNCTYTAGLYNSTGASGLAEFSLTNNSDIVTATLISKLTNSCNSTTSDFTITNQATYSDRPKGNVRVTTGVKGDTTSYIKTLRVYEIDEYGVFNNTPIDLDLDPDTSDYYGPSVPFPDLETVNPSNLVAGTAYSIFIEEFEKLMDNVSLVRYGVVGKHKLRGWPSQNGTYITVGSAPVHNPSGPLFGINRNDAYMKIHTSNGDKFTNTASFLTGSSGFSGTTNYSVSCGSISLGINTTYIDTPVDYSQTSFNKIVLTSNFATTPVTYTVNSLSCATKDLVAMYDSTNVISVQWKNPSNTVISTTASAVATTTGTYTFEVTLNTGCIIQKTIVI